MAQLTPASDAARHYSRAHTEQFRHELHELMRLPVIMMGYRLDDDGLHGPNERLSIEMFHRGVETAIVYLEELARQPRRSDAAATLSV